MTAVLQSQPPRKLPQIDTSGIYEGRYRDTTPCLRAAGKLTATGESAENCLKPPDKRPDSPEVVRKFRASLQPAAGKTRVFYGKAYDPHLQIAKQMTHGTSVQPSFVAADLVNPRPISLYAQRTVDKKESIYASHQKAPLGACHDQSGGLPRGLNPDWVAFGIKTVKDGTAGELVNPDKTHQEVMIESEQGRELYQTTHFDFNVGDQRNRNYTYPTYNKSNRFGIPTPHENDGRHVRQSLHWLHDDLTQKRAPVVSKRVDSFRERTQPQLGKVHDPIKDTMHVGPDHTFGILLKPDEYGAGDLMHQRMPGSYLRGKDRQRGIIAAMRQHLKKANYHNFPDLLAAFKHYDTNNNGKICKSEMRSACMQFNLPVDSELLDTLMEACEPDPTGQIDYIAFTNFLNWKDKMPSGLPNRLTQSAPSSDQLHGPHQPLADRPDQENRLSRQIDDAVGKHQTSSGMINAIIGGISTKDYRCYGVPTIRTDLPAPRIRRIDDRTNYGDQSNAFGLVNKSIYSSHGVYEKDFLMPRPKEQIRDVFAHIGVNMDLETFDRLYSLAASRHPQGQVSVESFRGVLDEAQALYLSKSSAV